MGIDVRTGTVAFDDGTTLTRRMPRSELPNERRGTGAIDGTEFAWSLELDDGELARVTLVHASLTTLDPERARDLHDAWLAERLGDGRPWMPGARQPYGGVEYAFRWGKVGSYAYPQDMNAFIAVDYKRRRT